MALRFVNCCVNRFVSGVRHVVCWVQPCRSQSGEAFWVSVIVHPSPSLLYGAALVRLTACHRQPSAALPESEGAGRSEGAAG